MTQQRRSIRLPGYDYRWPGVYFVTLVTQNRAHLFGEIVDGEVKLSPAGQMVDRWWCELTSKFIPLELDAYVIMPTHLHGTIVNPHSANQPQGRAMAAPLSTVIQWFKTMTTNEYIRQVKQAGWPSFEGRVWQRNYYEHVVRDEADLERIRRYLVDNPAHWSEDEENPNRS